MYLLGTATSYVTLPLPPENISWCGPWVQAKLWVYTEVQLEKN